MHTLLRLLLIGLLAAGAAGALGAQSSTAGAGRVTLAVTAHLVVPYHLKVRELAPARVVSRSAESTELELMLDAAANVSWTLAVADGSVGPQTAGLEVMDGLGAWRPIAARGAPEVVARGGATNGERVTLRLRVRAEADARALSRLRLVLMPAEDAR
jgi:hypothetical protein